MSTPDRRECSDECREALRRLDAFLDGELGEVTTSRLEEHLADCSPCTDRADFEERVRELVRRGCADQAPASLRERIVARLDELELTELSQPSR